MKVREIMTSDVGTCRPEANLTQAATIMWQRDCGVVPVVDENKRVVGMITDRDICIAAASRNQPASQITVGEVIYGKIKSCAPEDDAEKALKTMKKSQLRRLPVVNEAGILVGILSLSDLLRHAGKGGKKVASKKLLAALAEISRFRPVKLHFLNVEGGEEREEKAKDDADASDEDDRDAAADEIDEQDAEDENGDDSGDDEDDEENDEDDEKDDDGDKVLNESAAKDAGALDDNSTLKPEDAENSPGVIL